MLDSHHRCSSLRQTWPAPSRPMPIVTIGAGSIVVDAHFPAYRKGGFPIAGVFDLELRAGENGRRKVRRARLRLARRGAVEGRRYLRSRHAARRASGRAARAAGRRGGADAEADGARSGAGDDDLARVPGAAADGGGQLPASLRGDDAGGAGRGGARPARRLVDVEVHLSPTRRGRCSRSSKELPRIEIAVHSIHYLDFLRALSRRPGRACTRKTIGHPRRHGADAHRRDPGHGAEVRCVMSINHNHDFGRAPGRDVPHRGDGGCGARQARRAARLSARRAGRTVDHAEGEAAGSRCR